MSEREGAGPAGAVGSEARRGVVLLGAGSLGRQVVQFLAFAFFARQLGPEGLGLFALALAIVGLAQLVAGAGLGTALIRRGRLDPDQQTSALWVQAGLAAVVGVGLYFAAPLARMLVDDPELPRLVRTMTPGFLLVASVQTRRALLVQTLQFRALAGIELCALVLGCLVGAVGVVRGHGVLSLAVGSLAHQLALALGILARAGLPRGRFDLRTLAGLDRAASLLTGSAVVQWLGRRLDKVVVGVTLGPHALGLYERAWALASLPTTHVEAATGPVLHPVLARAGARPRQFRMQALSALRRMLRVSLPIAVVTFLSASELVALALGPRFAEAGPVLRVLAILMAVAPLLHWTETVLLALGDHRLHLVWSLVRSLLGVGGVALGASLGGVLGAASGLSAASVVLAVLAPVLVARSAREPAGSGVGQHSFVSAREIGATLTRPACIAGLVTLAALAARPPAVLLWIAAALVVILMEWRRGRQPSGFDDHGEDTIGGRPRREGTASSAAQESAGDEGSGQGTRRSRGEREDPHRVGETSDH